MRNKKIKILCPMTADKDQGGGIKSTIALLNGLSNKDCFEIHVLLIEKVEFLSKFSSKIKIHFFNYYKHISIRDLYSFLKTIKAFKKQIIDLGFCENEIILCSDRPALMLSFLLRKSKLKFIYISRGLLYDSLSARLLRFFMFPYVEHFVGISTKQFNLMLKYSSAEKVSKIFNGFTIKNKLNFIPIKKHFKIAVIGGIGEIKNQLQIIKVVHLLKDKYPKIELYIYGACFVKKDEAYLNTLNTYIKNNNVNNVNFSGHVEDPNLLFNSSLVVSSSISEGFGRTLIEAMAYKVPVIANANAGGPLDIIEHNKTGLLYNGTDEGLKKSIEFVLENPNEVGVLVESAYNSYCNKFTEQEMINNYVNLLKSI